LILYYNFIRNKDFVVVVIVTKNNNNKKIEIDIEIRIIRRKGLKRNKKRIFSYIHQTSISFIKNTLFNSNSLYIVVINNKSLASTLLFIIFILYSKWKINLKLIKYFFLLFHIYKYVLIDILNFIFRVVVVVILVAFLDFITYQLYSTELNWTTA
jgi:hypothetical protein